MAVRLHHWTGQAPYRRASVDSKTTTFKKTKRKPLSQDSTDDQRPKPNALRTKPSLGAITERDAPFGEWEYLPHPRTSSAPKLDLQLQTQAQIRAMENVRDLQYLNHRDPRDSEKIDNEVEARTLSLLSYHDSRPDLSYLRQPDSTPSVVEEIRDPQFDLAWGEVNRSRGNVQNLRDKTQEQRMILEELQKKKAEADERYIALIRTGHVGIFRAEETEQSWREELIKRWEACQSARNKYGPEDELLTTLEDLLTAEELNLKVRELKFYQTWLSQPRSHAQLSRSGNGKSEKPSSSVPTIAPFRDDESSWDSKAEEYHPLVEELLERLGNLDLLKEKNGELLMQRAVLEEDKILRERVGRTLQPDDLEFLDNFSALYAETTKEIRATQFDISQLRERCLQERLIDDEDNPTGLQQQLSLQEERTQPDSSKSMRVIKPSRPLQISS